MIFKGDLINTISKAAIIGTGIVFAANIICLAIAYARADKVAGTEQIGMFTIILAIVGIADLVIGAVMKNKVLSPLFDTNFTVDKDNLWQYSLKATIVTAAICSALPFYGLVAVLIEGNMNIMVAFAIASLSGFMILRLRPRDFDKLKLDQYNH